LQYHSLGGDWCLKKTLPELVSTSTGDMPAAIDQVNHNTASRTGFVRLHHFSVGFCLHVVTITSAVVLRAPAQRAGAAGTLATLPVPIGSAE